MRLGIHQPQYLPWIGYFDRMASVDQWVFLDTVQYVKNYFQQRTKVRVPQGSMWLTVPVSCPNGLKTDIADVEIAADHNWRHRHRQTLQVTYARSPHYAQHASMLDSLYDQEWSHLVDLNIATIDALASAFGITVPCVRASQIEGIGGAKSDLVLSVCQAMGADSYVSGPTGRTYLDEDRFADAGVQIVYQDFRHPLYTQPFGEFEPYMSAADWLFCDGPRCGELLGTMSDLVPAQVSAAGHR